MKRRIAGVICVVVVAAGLMASCGDSDEKLTRDEFIGQMTSGEDAIPADIATCIGDAFEDAGISVSKDGEPSEEDREEATEIATNCITEVAGLDPAALEDLTTTTTAAP